MFIYVYIMNTVGTVLHYTAHFTVLYCVLQSIFKGAKSCIGEQD